MSTCISRHGEYGSHTVGDDFVCTLCGVLDEDGLIEELNGARQALRRIADKLDIAQAAEPSLIADLTLRYVDAAAVNLAGALEAADAAHERLSTLNGIADGERELRAAQMERERDEALAERDQLWDATGIARDRPVEFLAHAIENMVDTSRITRTQLRPQLARAEADADELRRELDALQQAITAATGNDGSESDVEAIQRLGAECCRAIDAEIDLRDEVERIADEYDAPPGIGYSGAKIAARLRELLAPVQATTHGEAGEAPQAATAGRDWRGEIDQLGPAFADVWRLVRELRDWILRNHEAPDAVRAAAGWLMDLVRQRDGVARRLHDLEQAAAKARSERTEAEFRVVEIRREMAAQQQVFETMQAETRDQRDAARRELEQLRGQVEAEAVKIRNEMSAYLGYAFFEVLRGHAANLERFATTAPATQDGTDNG